MIVVVAVSSLAAWICGKNSCNLEIKAAVSPDGGGSPLVVRQGKGGGDDIAISNDWLVSMVKW